MKKTKIKVVALVMAGLTTSLTACKKELNANTSSKGKTSNETEKKPVYDEGIKSNDGYSSGTTALLGYYEFWGLTPGQQSVVSVPLAASSGTGTVKALGAATGIIVYAYRDSYGQQYLDAPGYYSTPIFTSSYATFTPLIEEIELDPQTNNVYALVTESDAKRIYVIDSSTGVATLVTVNGSANAFVHVTTNGYKSGSITFVPDGSGGYEFVFTNESTVYASLGVVSWHFTLSGTNLTSVSAHHRTYAGIPGTGNLNTTYGNGKLYFTRDGGSSNTLYSLSLTTNDSFVNEGISVTNKNDFGYYKAF